MSIIPATRLSRSDLNRLSNNIGRSKRSVTSSADAPYRRVSAAVNRSLSSVGERVATQHPATFPTEGDRGF